MSMMSTHFNVTSVIKERQPSGRPSVDQCTGQCGPTLMKCHKYHLTRQQAQVNKSHMLLVILGSLREQISSWLPPGQEAILTNSPGNYFPGTVRETLIVLDTLVLTTSRSF